MSTEAAVVLLCQQTRDRRWSSLRADLGEGAAVWTEGQTSRNTPFYCSVAKSLHPLGWQHP